MEVGRLSDVDVGCGFLVGALLGLRATAPEPGLVPVPWFVKTEHVLVPPGLFFIDFFIEFTS